MSLELIYREMLLQHCSTNVLDYSRCVITCECCEFIKRSLLILCDIDLLQSRESEMSSTSPSLCYTGSAGRPPFHIPPSQLIALLESGFTIPKIADLIGVSVRTIGRRMSACGLSIRARSN